MDLSDLGVQRRFLYTAPTAWLFGNACIGVAMNWEPEYHGRPELRPREGMLGTTQVSTWLGQADGQLTVSSLTSAPLALPPPHTAW